MEARKNNATGKGGEVAGSHANAISTGGNSTPSAKQFNADAFQTACTGDIATLHLALLNLATGHPLTAPTMIHFAGRGIALAFIAAGGVL
ncbi:MAG: hypothetical protein EPN14_02500 [Gallionella sp.]|nr:MAG: hypothetical protein EPN14_02500 [Gallionella sp.]